MFEGVVQAGSRFRPWRWAAIALLAGAELGLVRALDLFQPPAPVRDQTVQVRLIAPRQSPGLPPPRGNATQRRPRSTPPPPAPSPALVPLVQPRQLTTSDLADAPSSDSRANGGQVPGSTVGQEAGVVGGAGDGAAAAAAPIPARPADLLLVRAGLARKFVYPTEALRRRWVGKVVLAFTLHADGSLAGLTLRSSSGHSVLDDAALEAARAAAPFDPPGVDVLVVVPVLFRLG